jgi:tRNA (mo5U34)-methyltransferase
MKQGTYIGTPTKDELQGRINSIQWYHEFDFGDGLHARVNTPDAASHRALWRFIQSKLDEINFTDKTVLDIGCWDGYWSFYAERRGAKRVLATDDSGQNWAGEAGFMLAGELLKSGVESDLQLSVYDLGRLGSTYDIILCLGVYYHLFDPFYAFAQIRHRCHDNSIVIFEGDAFFGLHETPDQSAALYSRDPRKAPRFVPDPKTLRFLLNSAYFEIVAEYVFPLSQSDREDAAPTGVNRMFLVCRAARGLNDCHLYQPPFGLKQYDDRRELPPRNWSERLIRQGAELAVPPSCSVARPTWVRWLRSILSAPLAMRK